MLRKKRAVWMAGIIAIALVTAAVSAAPPERTFTRDVAPILYKNCAGCHRPGEAAPMSLLSYQDARPWAKSIREKVVTRQMPPWHADPRHGEFANDRRLDKRDVDTIVQWVDSGAREGNPKDLPRAPKFVEGWGIGTPDVVLPMTQEFTLEPTGPDEYRIFQIPTNFTEDRWVQLVEARPGNRKIVHHILAFVQPPPTSSVKAPQLPAGMQPQMIFKREGFVMRVRDDAPVYDDGCAQQWGGSAMPVLAGQEEWAFGGLGMFLVGFAPGTPPTAFASGTAKRIPAGSRLVLQVHYSKTSGQAEKDRSMIGLVFAKEPPARQVVSYPIMNHFFRIPAGAERHKVTACWTPQEDVHLVTLGPHMHFRGAAMTIDATYPDGKTETLVGVPNYDFGWQTIYRFKQPKAIPKGTHLLVTGYFDNSTKNKTNPDPTKAVRFGEPTYDEMMIGFAEFTRDAERIAPAAPTSAGGGSPR